MTALIPDVASVMILDTMSGPELRRLRERAGVTQEELAKLAEVHWRTILRWETSQVPIPALAALGLKQILTEHRGKK